MVTAGDAATYQPNIADHAAAGGSAKQANKIRTTAVDGEVAEGVAQAVERAGESIALTHWLPIADTAQVNIAAHSIVDGQVTVHGLQRRSIVDHGVADHTAGRAFLGGEVVAALQIDGGVDVVVRRAAIGSGLAVLQGDFAVCTLGRDGGVDVDVVMSVQRQRGVGIPGNGGLDVDVARFATAGHCLQGDAVVSQVGR